MSQEPLVTKEVIARQPPEAQAIIRALLARIAELDARVAELEARLNKTPRCRRRASIRTPGRFSSSPSRAGSRAASPVIPSTSGRCSRRKTARR